MTELAEPVELGSVSIAGSSGCPFDHDGPPDRNKRNILIGKGSKLAAKLKQGRKTDLYDKSVIAEVLNPRYIEGHPFHSPGSLKADQKVKKRRDKWPVLVNYPDGESERLPVRCAAHHLVPSQESLQFSKILVWMVKKDTSEPLKSEDPVTDGRVWCDVGYDTNGASNGVYLPGSYAVGGGRGGLRLWDTSDSSDEDGEGDEDTADEFRPLTGSATPIDPKSPKWQYVSQAIVLSHHQFHDRHDDYSQFVIGKLDALASSYEKRLAKSGGGDCDDCATKKKRWKAAGEPTPADLIARLDSISRQLKSLLDGSVWATNVYTSKWMREYMTRRRARAKWAKL